MNSSELKEILTDHRDWLNHRDLLNNSSGSRADLRYASLRGADLRDADLRGADLRYADLRDANLRYASLRGADLRDADLRDANLLDANLRDADLRYADLRYADLRYASLRYANLRYADLLDANLLDASLRGANLRGAKNLSPMAAAQLQVCPQKGSFIAWKSCRNTVVKLEIPADANRSNGTSRKCRASHVKVLDVIGEDDYGVGIHDMNTVYRKGETVTCHEWNPNRWEECSGGIHFFMTREEAESYE